MTKTNENMRPGHSSFKLSPSTVPWIFLVFVLASGLKADAMFMFYQTESVPIARVFTNLQQRLAKNTNDFEITYYLARLNSMVYSTNLTHVNVRTNNDLPQFEHPAFDTGVPGGVQQFSSPAARTIALDHLTNAIILYQRALYLLKKSTNIYEKTWMICPTQLGLAWSLAQAGRTNDAISMCRKALNVAWKQEVTGDFDFRQWVKDAMDDVHAGRNPLRNHAHGSLGPGISYSEETISSLLKLLDPVKDASEIAKLKNDQKTLQSMGRAITPILIPMEAGLRFDELVDERARVPFDLDGSGLNREWQWITPRAGWLVYDPAGSGKISSALQMFGSVTFWIFWPNGYAALSSLDDNGDGVLSGQELLGLAIWNDKNGNGISDPGEVIPLEALGICEISCHCILEENGVHWNPRGVTFVDGRARATYDWIVPSPALALQTSSSTDAEKK
jgi:hypothetical protein